MKFPDGAALDEADCLPCQLEVAEDRAVVFRDALWSCEVTPGFEVPGWYVLRTRRHALGWHELNQDELESFGRHAGDLVTAVREVFDSPATYLLNFGEAYPHFHCLVAVRGDDVPSDRRLSRILDQRAEQKDRERSL